MCRPDFIPYEGEYAERSYLDIQQLRHPCVSTKPFVPNNLFMDPKV
jgi:hypothetical protein